MDVLRGLQHIELFRDFRERLSHKKCIGIGIGIVGSKAAFLETAVYCIRLEFLLILQASQHG